MIVFLTCIKCKVLWHNGIVCHCHKIFCFLLATIRMCTLINTVSQLIEIIFMSSNWYFKSCFSLYFNENYSPKLFNSTFKKYTNSDHLRCDFKELTSHFQVVSWISGNRPKLALKWSERTENLEKVIFKTNQLRLSEVKPQTRKLWLCSVIKQDLKLLLCLQNITARHACLQVRAL